MRPLLPLLLLTLSLPLSAQPVQRQLLDRLPGMAAEPFNLCRDLARCPEAPLSMHVESEALIADAKSALSRPWAHLLKARGKTGDALEGFGLALRVTPVATGGFDVSLTGAEDPAGLYARERSAALASGLSGR